MKESTSKEKVLKSIRNALTTKKENPYSYIDLEKSVYNEQIDDKEVIFANEFTKVSGKFVFCEDYNEFLSNLQALILENKWTNVFSYDKKLTEALIPLNINLNNDPATFISIEAGISGCEYLIARLGSIMVSSRQMQSRRIAVYPPVHIVFAYTSQIVNDIKDAITAVKEKYGDSMPSLISFITGPSRTADIEKTLVMGAHGPKELYVFLIDDSKTNGTNETNGTDGRVKQIIAEDMPF